ncbi:MAG TPA: hypothetical protein VNQ76_13905 [Planctomicrobium sp.]|nr:hypothetical protein [Planctomicrobium sp.]
MKKLNHLKLNCSGNIRHSFQHYLLTILGLLIISGCSDSNGGRKHVAGTVKLAGQQVVYGTIEFLPDGSKGHSGPAEYAEIFNSQYDTRVNGAGVMHGPHMVRISIYDGLFPERGEEETIGEGVTGRTAAKAPNALCLEFPLEADLNSKTQDFELPESAIGYKP